MWLSWLDKVLWFDENTFVLLYMKRYSNIGETIEECFNRCITYWIETNLSEDELYKSFVHNVVAPSIKYPNRIYRKKSPTLVYTNLDMAWWHLWLKYWPKILPASHCIDNEK